ncbi:hypothetical protein [Xenorhabdus sp. KK7.4]|uniref:hypothetical protein n=1 Tax=Xenorhabdus sp. KK7.4 TaxID=1851572 RepID=UPI000C038FE5|nr:hypothetical protein Xekk_04174 [Xenorhabdus sp. KK7.4]
MLPLRSHRVPYAHELAAFLFATVEIWLGLIYMLDKSHKLLVFQYVACAQGAGQNDLTICFYITLLCAPLQVYRYTFAPGYRRLSVLAMTCLLFIERTD